MSLRYDVRVIEDGKVVNKRRFKLKDAAFNWAADRISKRKQVRVSSVDVFVPEYHENDEWTISPHDPWQAAPKPISEVFIHHSVTAQIPASASLETEREQMELLDRIAHGRGFNGFSYCWAVMPSARCWEGRGFGVVEAGTLGHNTSGDSIVLVGNYSEFEMSGDQKKAIIALIKRGQRQGFFVRSGLSVRPHRSVSQTSCPGAKVTDALIQEIQRAVN